MSPFADAITRVKGAISKPTGSVLSAVLSLLECAGLAELKNKGWGRVYVP